MAEKPPPYNPNVGYGPPGPPPAYQPNPPVYPPNPPPHVGFATPPSTSSTTFVSQQTTYGSIPVVVQPVHATDVIIVGGCPACRVGVLNEDFTLAGLCCAFWFFPIGILCCLAMRERRCSNCGAIFS
ncbi:membrane protein BRI3-like isoform X2 [Palaemon carinicauda]|uniref:membrane protein BRI3-like isoform X2 n=1 Tax=Palaemon carinicauda TaxID=392227 RepID=UPI0035B60EF8